jgi:hypothetical protein
MWLFPRDERDPLIEVFEAVFESDDAERFIQERAWQSSRAVQIDYETLATCKAFLENILAKRLTGILALVPIPTARRGGEVEDIDRDSGCRFR